MNLLNLRARRCWVHFVRDCSQLRNSGFWIEGGSMPMISRRHVLKSVASGFGYLAFSSLAHEAAAKESSSRTSGGLSPKAAHFPPRAKRVIFLCMNGGPSHVDLFDYQPALQEHSRGPSPVGRERGGAKLLGSPFQFAQHGASGMWMSEILPHIA